MRVTVIMRLKVDARARLAIWSWRTVHLPDRLVRCSPFPQIEGVTYVTRLTGVPVVFQLRRCAIVVTGLHTVQAEPLGVWELGRRCRFRVPLVPTCQSASYNRSSVNPGAKQRGVHARRHYVVASTTHIARNDM
jgi:hypothetical protein